MRSIFATFPAVQRAKALLLGSAASSLVVVSTALGMSACAPVAPYERGNLAHPMMSADDPISSRLDEHVRGVSEGANGGLSGGGGGCGCN
jgi:hypothetical protein